jgi:hypothetical protein
MVDGLFRNRQTGEITIAQAPSGALIIWAGDELIRGVNPFRRMVGTVVLIAIAVGLATG